jgi:FkbM family methyltransferase
MGYIAMKLVDVDAGDMRAVLKSRVLFENWHLLPLIYMFYRLMRKDPLRHNMKILFKDGKAFAVPLLMYGHILRGYYYGFIRDITYDEDSIIINGIKIRTSKELSKKNCPIDIGSVKFKKYYETLPFLYISQIYGLLNVKDRVVIDVGAFVGDSAIYFVLRGAKRVIALEPNPEAFKEMLENIKLNNMESKIIAINAGLSSKAGYLGVWGGIKDALTTYYGIDVGGTVKSMTLSEIIESVSKTERANMVLKMDCEGCEYDVIFNDYEHVKLFKEMSIEYHGNLRDLLKVLKHDFECFDIKRYSLLHCRRRRDYDV